MNVAYLLWAWGSLVAAVIALLAAFWQHLTFHPPWMAWRFGGFFFGSFGIYLAVQAWRTTQDRSRKSTALILGIFNLIALLCVLFVKTNIFHMR